MIRVLLLSVPTADVELAADRLWTAGARAVQESTGGSGLAVLRTVLAEVDAMSIERLGELPSSWTLSFEDVDEAPAETWRRFAQPMIINQSLVIRPAWLAALSPSAHTEIEIEPGASFGLGDHPTTRLSAEATWRLVRAGDRVLDVGCGSGVLSIIAACRGATEVVAIDIAEAARQATVDNARRNHVSDVVTASTMPIAAVPGQFDLVVANILAPALEAMAHDLRRSTASDGCLVLSGVLVGRFDHVLQTLDPMVVTATTALEGWAAIELRHP